MPSEISSSPQPAEATNKRFRDATRVLLGATSHLERKILQWLAERIPAYVSPDHLTLLGFASMLFAGGSYAFSRWHRSGLLLATFFLACNWLGDSLDGTLARFRNRLRPRYGFYVDHMIDAIGTCSLMAGAAVSGYIHPGIAAALLAVFLVLSIETYLASYTLGVFQLSFWGFGPTEIRLLLSLGNVTLWVNPHTTVPGLSWRLFDFGGSVALVAMAVIVLLAAARHAVKLYSEETRP